jgi:hypothetical protein
MLDLELFSDPVIAIDKRFQVTNSNSIFMQFYNVNKRKVIQKRLDELFELSEEFINNEVPFNMLVPKEIGVLFGSRVSQNVQVFKTYHPDYEGQVLVHLKDVDAEVKLHNKNLNKLNSSNDLVELDLELLEEILEEEKCAVFKLKGETFQSIYSHFFPEFRDDDLKDFIKFLKDNFKPNVDWVSFFKVLGMNTVEFNDIKELIPDKIEYKNRILELKILPFVNDNSFLMIFKDQSESLKDFTTNENREVLSKFYSLFVKNPTLLSLFLLEINFLISKDNNQKMAYTLHSLKGLLHFIGLKKLAHDTHILEFMPDESEKRKEFDILRARIQTFLKSNKISNDLVQVDQNVLNVLNAPLDQFLSIDALVKNFDGMVRFYLDNIQSNYMVFKDDLTTFFITRNVATALISIFNHLLRNVGAHGEEQSFKVQVLLQENSEITIRMRNEYKKEQLDKIPFLSGHDIGVNIVQEISQEHDIFFKFNESEKYYENNLVFKVLDKSELVK